MSEAGLAKHSLAHEHIFTVIRTLIAEGRLTIPAGGLRVLDVGCGDGRLMAALLDLAERHLPGVVLDVHGFDIGEHGFSDEQQMREALQFLATSHPAIRWTPRVRIISQDEAWGYPPNHFDLVVSNQVIEHVFDLPHFLRNLRAVLRTDGVSIHFFPLRHCVLEAHCKVPFAHWIRDHEYRVAWLAIMSRIGIGRYLYDRRVLGHATPHAHAEQTSHFIGRWTRYRSFAELATEAGRLDLSISYNFTKDFVFAKLRSLLRRPLPDRYRRRIAMGIEWLGFMIGRYISSSTLIIRSVEYDIGARIAAEKADRLGTPPKPADARRSLPEMDSPIPGSPEPPKAGAGDRPALAQPERNRPS